MCHNDIFKIIVGSTEVVFHTFPLLFAASDWLKVNHLSQAEQKAGSGFLNIFRAITRCAVTTTTSA